MYYKYNHTELIGHFFEILQLKQALTELRNKYVLVPADKATDKVKMSDYDLSGNLAGVYFGWYFSNQIWNFC